MNLLVMMPGWPGASELWMHRMIAALGPHLRGIATPDPRGHDSEGGIPVIPLGDAPPAAWRRWARRIGAPIPVRPSRTGADQLRRAIERLGIDTVLVHYLEFALMYEQVWAQVPARLFVHCHGYDATWDLRRHETPDTPYFPADYASRVRNLAQRAVIIANSSATERRLLDIGVAKERIAVKYLGVPVPDACPVRERPAAGIEILYLGRLIDCKGPDLTIRAFETACRRGLRGRLTLAGDGPLRVACDLLVRRSGLSGQVTLVGAVDASAGQALRDRAHVFTAHHGTGPLSRQEEAYGVSIVEAMAAGLPVVTGRSGGLSEVVADGESGILFEPGDVEAHADALCRLAQDEALRSRMGAAGWRRAREHFSIEREAAELARLLA